MNKPDIAEWSSEAKAYVGDLEAKVRVLTESHQKANAKIAYYEDLFCDKHLDSREEYRSVAHGGCILCPLSAAQASAAEAFNDGIETSAQIVEGSQIWASPSGAPDVAKKIRSMKRTAPEPAGEGRG